MTDTASAPAPSPILAAHNWTSNAHLIEDCAALGYLREDWMILDPTYGSGTWWKRWQPAILFTHDIAIDGVDFRNLPYDDGHFDAVAYDPPYVAKGGRDTSGIKEMDERYGQVDCPATPALLQQLINEGLQEVTRVTKVGGYILVKCQDYVSSGKLWLGTHHTLNAGLTLGLELVDRFEHVGGVRPQPPGRRQVHARRNLSTLFVFKKKKLKVKRRVDPHGGVLARDDELYAGSMWVDDEDVMRANTFMSHDDGATWTPVYTVTGPPFRLTVYGDADEGGF